MQEAPHALADDLHADPLVRRAPMYGGGSLARDGVPRDSQIRRAPSSNGLYDVLDLILDKGIVIDAFVRVSLVGIELVTIDLRVVVASVDTYLRYAEGVERLQLYDRSGAAKLSDIAGGKGKMVAKGAKKLKDKVAEATDGDDDEVHRGEGSGIAGSFSRGVRNVFGKVVDTIAGPSQGRDDDEGEEDENGHGQQRRERPRAESRQRPAPEAQGRRHAVSGSKGARK